MWNGKMRMVGAQQKFVIESTESRLSISVDTKFFLSLISCISFEPFVFSFFPRSHSFASSSSSLVSHRAILASVLVIISSISRLLKEKKKSLLSIVRFCFRSLWCSLWASNFHCSLCLWGKMCLICRRRCRDRSRNSFSLCASFFSTQ